MGKDRFIKKGCLFRQPNYLQQKNIFDVPNNRSDYLFR